jgi:hypothetical protein
MKNKPSGFLSHSKSAPDLVRTNPVLGIGNHPNGTKPLIQTKRAILEDTTHFDAELLFAGLATPNQTSLNEPLLFASTVGANYTISPTEANYEIMSVLFVSEVNHSFLQCFRLLICHLVTSFPYCVFSISGKSLCVKYIIAQSIPSALAVTASG